MCVLGIENYVFPFAMICCSNLSISKWEIVTVSLKQSRT